MIGLLGMESGLLAGVLSALAVFIAQSYNVQHPINGHSSAEMLRSSKWNRSAEAIEILEDDQIFVGNLPKMRFWPHLHP